MEAKSMNCNYWPKTVTMELDLGLEGWVGRDEGVKLVEGGGGAFLAALSIWHWWVVCVWYRCVWGMEGGPWQAWDQRSRGRPVHEMSPKSSWEGLTCSEVYILLYKERKPLNGFLTAMPSSNEGYGKFQKGAIWKMNHRVRRWGQGNDQGTSVQAVCWTSVHHPGEFPGGSQGNEGERGYELRDGSLGDHKWVSSQSSQNPGWGHKTGCRSGVWKMLW